MESLEDLSHPAQAMEAAGDVTEIRTSKGGCHKEICAVRVGWGVMGCCGPTAEAELNLLGW